jgi:hypothetical protein
MNKKGNIGARGPYWFFFILLFALWILFLAGQTKPKSVVDVNLNNIRESVVVNRVIVCLSGEEFGVIEISKVNQETIDNCLSNYNVEIKLESVDGFLFDSLQGKLQASRYVLVNNKPARLDVRYQEKTREGAIEEKEARGAVGV